MDLERALQAEVTAESVLRTRLAHGERVLWQGKPRTGILWDPGTRHVQLVVLAFAALLSVLSFKGFQNPDSSLRFFAFLLMVHPINHLLLLPLMDAFRRRRTAYALTDRRVVIARGGLWRHKIQSLPLKEIAEIHLIEGPGGLGTIHLGRDPEWRQKGELRFIERPREVSDLIRQAQLTARFPETPGSSATQVSPAL